MNKWQIKDLQGVGDVELSLDDSKRVFVLFGTNGVGKTKILGAIGFFLSLKLPNSIINTTRFKLNAKSFELVSCNTEYLDHKHHSEVEDFIIKETDEKIKRILYKPELLKTIKQDIDAICYIATYSRLDKDDSGKKSRNSYLEHVGSPQHDIKKWIISKAQSTNPYQKEHKVRKNEIECLLEVLNKFDDRIKDSLTIDFNNNVYLEIDGKERELSELSSGFRSIVRIFQAIISAYSYYQEDTDNLLAVKGIVLIDEIENHLHLEWQVKIIPTLKKLFPNTTFYIATHSPLVLSQLEEGEAYLLKRDEDGVVRSQVINSPNTRLLENVLPEAFDIDLNELKRQNMENIDQTKVQQKLLKLLNG